MPKLIHSELLKLMKSTAYRVLVICAFALGILMFVSVILSAQNINGLDLLSQTFSDQGQVVLIIFFAAMFICGEYTNRTAGLAIFGGHYRRDILLAKAIVSAVASCVLVIIYPIVCTALVSYKYGFGDAINASMASYMARAILLYMFGGAGMACFFTALAVLIKNTGGVIGASLGAVFLWMILGNIPVFAPVMKFTLLMQLSQVALINTAWQTILYLVITAATIIATVLAAAVIFKKSELN